MAAVCLDEKLVERYLQRTEVLFAGKAAKLPSVRVAQNGWAVLCSDNKARVLFAFGVTARPITARH